MSRSPILTDSLIREALSPDPRVAAPAGLLAAIDAGVRMTPQRRPLLLWPWGSDLGVPARRAVSPQLAWALAAVALLAALLAGALVGARLLEKPYHIDLVPTGIDTLTPEIDYGSVVADGAATLWATGPGHVTRFDAETGKRRTWTISDDGSFNASIFAAAKAGGVWLWTPGEAVIRRFDGSAFPETIPAPPATGWPALAEGPSGSLWAAAPDGLWRWDGSAWVAAPDTGSLDEVGGLLVLADDDVWVGRAGPDPAMHLSGDRWETLPRNGTWAWSGTPVLAAAPDRSIWAVSGTEVAHYAGGTWTLVDGPGFPMIDLAVDADGAVWAISGERPGRVARLLAGAWTILGPETGLPDAAMRGISATDAGVFAGTEGGLYRFADGRWVPAWPDMQDGPGFVGSLGRRLLAIGEEEAWAADDRGLWHLVDGDWVGPDPGLQPGADIRSLATGPDGTLFAASNWGVSILREGTWTTAWTGNATSVTVAPDGSAWVAAGSPALVHLSDVDGTWSQVASVSCPAGGWLVAATTDGSVWTAGIGYNGTAGLARFDGRSCTEVLPLGPGRAVEILDLGADPVGGLVAFAFEETVAGGPNTDGKYRTSTLRFDGTTWTVLRDAKDGGAFGDVAVAPSGDVWLAGNLPGSGIRRYVHGAWQDVTTLGWFQLSIAPDGSAWFVGPSGIQRIRAEIVPEQAPPPSVAPTSTPPTAGAGPRRAD